MRDKRLTDSLGWALTLLFRQVNRASSRAFLPHGVSAEQAQILLLLWLDRPMKIGDLQRELMLSSGTLTGAIDRMEKSGLVKRVEDPADERAWRVVPTLIDVRRRRGIVESGEAVEATCFAALSAAEQRTLLRLLRKTSDGLVGKAKRGARARSAAD